ncbi:MAG: hydrolase [Candidatus Binatia bacterium]|nr:MAG: hydrolase [Candidatus Binatia bacterium]
MGASGRIRLIVSGDDFGMSPGTNAGILEAYRKGILRQASLMVAGDAAEEAVAAALREPGLAVGLHLVLVQGRSALPPYAALPLVDFSGEFPKNPVAAGVRYFFRRSLRDVLRREIRAQLEAFSATGLPLSHVDGHLTIHLHPVVLDVLCDLAPRYGIRAVRVPREPLLEALRFDRRDFPRKLAEGATFRLLGSYARRRLRRAGIFFADRVYGMHQSGRVDERYLLFLSTRLPEGVTELYGHPAYADEGVRRWTPTYDREEELRALCSPRVREALESRGVVLSSYADLVGSCLPSAGVGE